MAESKATAKGSRTGRVGAKRTPARRSAVRATVEEAIAELRAGRSIIVTDDEDRENEGDVVSGHGWADSVNPRRAPSVFSVFWVRWIVR